MLGALKSVQEDGLSSNQAADLHGVLSSTLKDRLIKWPGKAWCKARTTTILRAEEELT